LTPTFFGALDSLYGPYVFGGFPALHATLPSSNTPASVRFPDATNPPD